MLAEKTVARASLACGLAGGVTALVATAGAHLGILRPFTGLSLASVALILSGFPGLLLGLAALLRKGAGAYRNLAIAGTAVGTLMLLIPAVLGARAGQLPPIHDLTTDLEDPPVFVHAAEIPANRDRDLSYPHGLEDTAKRQQEGYPELAEPIFFAGDRDRALEAALETAESLGWRVEWRSEDGNRFEATHTSTVFRLVDDIVVRIRPTEGGSLLDLRATAREGVSDMGRNARHIQRFAESLSIEQPL
ncbi:MAG: DUF1499 domain-containing protein [Acidobacteriota bacterium]|nr:DUF1499 domain-containing protein [Acidobacteriota bacterium]